MRHLSAALLCLAVGLCRAASAEVSILTWNLENLFDTEDAPLRRDESFLPLSAKRSEKHRRRCAELERRSWRRTCLKLDWSEATLEGKIRALAKVIRHAGNPDLLVLQEVENQRVLHLLADALPAAGEYRYRVLIEGDDERGIDQAVITRLAKGGEPRLHRRPGLPGRGVLEVPLRLPGGEVLRVLAVHLPAPYHPQSMRLDALRSLRRIAPAEELTVIAGDFNLTREDERNPQIAAALKPFLQAQDFCRRHCAGTHYYGAGAQWDWLDRILLPHRMGPDGAACWRLDPQSVWVVLGAPGQVTRGGYPRSYRPKSGKGASDHLPLALNLRHHC